MVQESIRPEAKNSQYLSQPQARAYLSDFSNFIFLQLRKNPPHNTLTGHFHPLQPSQNPHKKIRNLEGISQPFPVWLHGYFSALDERTDPAFLFCAIP